MSDNVLIIYVLFCHFVADFVCQSRWMGRNKGRTSSALWAHIGMYSLVMLSLLGWVAASFVGAAWYIVVNGVAHLYTDAVSSTITSHFWTLRTEATSSRTQEKYEHLFWCTIGLDQFLHVVVLIGFIHFLES